MKKTHHSALQAFFRINSTFNQRWKKTWWKDYMSPGVYKAEFQDCFTAKELRQLIQEGRVKEAYHTDPKHGGRRAVILWIERELPQLTRFKRFTTHLVDTFKEATPMMGVYLYTALLVLGVVLLIALAPWKKAFGFGEAPSQPNIQTRYPLPGVLKYFDDTEIQVRCYWIGSELRLTCVRKTNKF